MSGVHNRGVACIRSEDAKPNGKGFLQKLLEYVPFDLPTAAQDEDIIITAIAPVLSYGSLPSPYTISVYYLDQDTGDVTTKTVPGGSAALSRLYINDMTNSAIQPATGQSLLDTVLTPSGLNGIADNMKQTAGLKLTGFLFLFDASALGDTYSGNANGRPTRLHITDVDTELFTVETQEGLLVDRNVENALAFDHEITEAFIPQNPYVFHQNRNFRFKLDTVQLSGTGLPFAALTQYFAIVGIREPETA